MIAAHRRLLLQLGATGLLLGGAVVFASAAETGRLLSRLFLPEDYRGESQVTDVVQTPDNLIYAATLGAVKEYDGHAWRTIPIPTTWIMDLCPGDDGRVYVAAYNTFGVLEVGQDGRRAFRSLLGQVPANLQPLGQEWTVRYQDGAAYWSTNRLVMRWRDGVLRTWSFPDKGRRVVYSGGRSIYMASTAGELMRLAKNDEWEIVSTGPMLERLPPLVVDDWGAPGITVLDATGRMWRFDASGTATELPCALHGVLATTAGARLGDSMVLRDGRIAITSKNAGIFVLNREGAIDLRFGLEGGLSVPDLYSVSEDVEGGLWVGSTLGLVRVELDPSLTVFDEKNGAPPGIGYVVARHAGTLYACGADGVYRLVSGDEGVQARFERVPAETLFTPYDMVDHPGGLVVSSDSGLFLCTGKTVTYQFDGPHSFYSLARSRSDPDRVFIGGGDFVLTARWDGTAWRNEGPIAGVEEDARSMVEDADGVLWVATPADGVVRVRRRPGHDDWQSAESDRFDTSRGLPEGHDWITVADTAIGPLFTHAKGVSVYDAASDRMIPSPAVSAAGVQGRFTFPLVGGKGSSIWMQLGYAAAGDTPAIGGLLPTAGGGWEWHELSPGVFTALGFLGAGEMVWEPSPSGAGEGVLWVLGQKSIVRWDLDGALRDRAASPPPVALRDIARGGMSFSLRPGERPTLDYAREPLRVSYASPVYALKGIIEYQHRLVGYDDRWSDWSQHGEAVFTNLSRGRYGFEARARRAAGPPGPVTRWDFVVRPPWWNSTPAVIGYLILGAGCVWLLLRWRMASLERERLRLEQVVHDRTEELARERDRAEAANRAKTMFLASMSHELRTPLHAILGYSQLLGGDQTLTEDARERLQIVASSGQHLLRLINEVLDLSKIEAGKLELRVAPFDLPGLLAEVARAQEARATAKGLVFCRPDLGGLPGTVSGDAQKLRQILDNLLGNAVKFTACGEVRLSVMPVAPGRLHFEVSDTGRGIAPEDLRRLFEPFSQVRGSGENPDSGTGLGLTISHRLVALMGGTLQVASTVGEGSRFWFDIDLAGLAGADATERRPQRRLIGYEGPRRRVLAIDDVEANRRLFRDLLAPLGFEVALAGSASEALALFEHVRPDLVLLDLRLPGVDGFALARQLRADPRLEGIRILAASASVFGHDPGEAVAAGCDGFISKPFLPEDFFARVGQLLDLAWREEEPAPPAIAENLEPAMLEALQSAARMGDVVALREALARLREKHPRAAALDEIERAIDAFDTDRVGFLAAQQLQAQRSP